MKRNQTFHEQLIPLLVEGVGAQSYLEFGTHHNETISWANCPKRTGVDRRIMQLPGASMYEMTTAEFIENHAAHHAPYDFVFIDAAHDYWSVNEDFCGIWPHVSPEGLVLLHDTNPEHEEDTATGLCGDAWKMTKFLKKEYEAVTLPYHPGLSIIRKREKWGPG